MKKYTLWHLKISIIGAKKEFYELEERYEVIVLAYRETKKMENMASK